MAGFLLLGLVFVAAALGSLVHHGLSARDRPTMMEERVARLVRQLAVPAAARRAKNPVAPSEEVLRMARAHFADHCALCHDHDGSGRTPIGQGLYPKAPDMRSSATQSLSDGELFYIIVNGVRLTGMPACGQGSAEENADTWGLVRLIRHLPRLSTEELTEMRGLAPRTRRDLQEEAAEQRFLEGGDAVP